MTKGDGFTARPRRAPDGVDVERLLAECERLRSRFERAARGGRAAFASEDSDSYDIGMLAVIHLADFVARELPLSVQNALPEIDREGLRATRNIATRNYAGLDNARLWKTVTESAPALLDLLEAALRGT